MGARRGTMLARPIRSESELLAPAGLELLVPQRSQGFGHVRCVPALRPGDDKGSGGKGECFVEAEAPAVVAGTYRQVRVQEKLSGFLGLGSVRPVFGRRRPQVATIFSEVKAWLGLNKILDVDHAVAMAIPEELVVFVVTMRGDWSLARQPLFSRADLLQEIAQHHVNAGSRELELLEALVDAVNLDFGGVRFSDLDTGRMDMADHPTSDLTLIEENLRVAVALDLLPG